MNQQGKDFERDWLSIKPLAESANTLKQACHLAWLKGRMVGADAEMETIRSLQSAIKTDRFEPMRDTAARAI